MNKSKSKTKSSSTATVAPNPIYAPQIDSAAATLKPAYEASQANVNALLPKVNAGIDYYSDVINGKYLNSNPFLQNVIDKSNADITSTVGSRFEGAGRYGSGMYAGVLAKALADNENSIRFSNYNTERGYQQAAPAALGGVASTSAALPQVSSSAYAEALASLLGRYTTGNEVGKSTTKSSGNLLGMLLQAGAEAGKAAASAGAG